MKNAMIGFVFGVLIASVGWFVYVQLIHAKNQVEMCGFFAGEAAFAEKLMAEAQSPSQETRLHTQQVAGRMVSSWIHQVDDTDQKYPFTHVKENCSSQYSEALALLDKWKKESSSNTNQTFDAMPNTALEPTPTAP